MSTFGFNFRGSSGYATDAANATYVLAETTSQTRNGISFYWTALPGGGGADRSTAPDNRLKGLNYLSPNNNGTFSVTLPTTGDKDIRVAMGDPYFSSWGGLTLVFKDNGTTLYTLGPYTPAGGNVIDANGNEYSAAQWPANNTQKRLTFSSTAFTMVLSANAGQYRTICHIEIVDVAAGGPNAIPGSSLAARQAVRRASYF